MLPNELDMTVSSAAPVLEYFRESRMTRQDGGGFIGRSRSEVIARSQSIHALMEGCLVDSLAVHQLNYFLELPRPGGLRLLEDEVSTSLALHVAYVNGEPYHFHGSGQHCRIYIVLVGD